MDSISVDNVLVVSVVFGTLLFRVLFKMWNLSEIQSNANIVTWMTNCGPLLLVALVMAFLDTFWTWIIVMTILIFFGGLTHLLFAMIVDLQEQVSTLRTRFTTLNNLFSAVNENNLRHRKKNDLEV